MTLKQQIEATIQAYQQACKLKNLNYKYCFNNGLQSGICYYCNCMKLFLLLKKIQSDLSIKSFYLCETPEEINFQNFFLKLRLYRAHQTRLQYLKNLLNTIENENLQTKN